MKTLTDYSWLPRGRLLSVVTDVHESPIVDIDYTGVYADEDDFTERLLTCSKDGIANVWKVEFNIIMSSCSNSLS